MNKQVMFEGFISPKYAENNKGLLKKRRDTGDNPRDCFVFIHADCEISSKENCDNCVLSQSDYTINRWLDS